MTGPMLLLVTSPVALLMLYGLGIQHERGGPWRVLKVLFAIGMPLDVLLNFSWFSFLFWDWPQQGEWTLSKRLPRLNRRSDLRGQIARAVTQVLDRLAPSGQHVKS